MTQLVYSSFSRHNCFTVSCVVRLVSPWRSRDCDWIHLMACHFSCRRLFHACHERRPEKGTKTFNKKRKCHQQLFLWKGEAIEFLGRDHFRWSVSCSSPVGVSTTRAVFTWILSFYRVLLAFFFHLDLHWNLEAKKRPVKPCWSTKDSIRTNSIPFTHV